jgi:hypothetical protein
VFPDLPPISVDGAPAGQVNHIEYGGETWDCPSSRRAKKKFPDAEEKNNVVGNGFDAFIHRIRFELHVIWPESPFTVVDLAMDLGAMIHSRSGHLPKGDDSELRDATLRTEFLLKWFDRARNRRST